MREIRPEPLIPGISYSEIELARLAAEFDPKRPDYDPAALIGRMAAAGDLQPDSPDIRAMLQLKLGAMAVLSDARTANPQELAIGRGFLKELIAAEHRQNETAARTYQATHDVLTGLKNRRGLEEDFEKIVGYINTGQCRGAALLFLDIDQFKSVNDLLGGHAAGDEVLVGIANVIRKYTRRPLPSRAGDTVARPGSDGQEYADGDDDLETETGRWAGDEYVLLVADFVQSRPIHPGREIRPAAQQLSFTDKLEIIRDRLEENIIAYLVEVTRGQIPGVGVSIGYAVLEDGMTAGELLRIADRDMYFRKEAKRQAKP